MDICIVAYCISLKNWASYFHTSLVLLNAASTFTNKNALFCFEFFRYRHTTYSCLAGSFKFVVVSGFMGVQYIMCRNTQELKGRIMCNSIKRQILKCFTRSLLLEYLHFIILMPFLFSTKW